MWTFISGNAQAPAKRMSARNQNGVAPSALASVQSRAGGVPAAPTGPRRSEGGRPWKALSGIRTSARSAAHTRSVGRQPSDETSA